MTQEYFSVWNGCCVKHGAHKRTKVSVISQSCRQHRDRFKNTSALNAPCHLGYTHQLCPLTERSETIKIEHIKNSLEKNDTTSWEDRKDHTDFSQVNVAKKKKNTEPRCSVNLIKITNVQCLEWVIQFMMQKLYRRQMVNTWDDLSRYSKCAWLLPLLALWGITHKTRENNPWMLPPTPVTPFDQATCLFPSLLAWLL